MTRDRPHEIPWATVSPIIGAIRERVERLGTGSGREFDEAVEAARPWLKQLAARGGDPRFALYVLAEARWRRPHPPRRPIGRGIRLIERLAADQELQKLLAGAPAPRGSLMPVLQDVLLFLRGFQGLDEGPFEGRTTRRHRPTPRARSRRVDRAIALLRWHLGQSDRRWGRQELLAGLLEAFGLLASRGGESPPVEALKKRSHRLTGNYYDRFVVPTARIFFHDYHRHLADRTKTPGLAQCSAACPDWGTH